MKSLELMRSIEPVELRRLRESSQQNIFYMCTFLGIISVVYILRDQGQNYLFILVVRWERRWVERKQKTVERGCALSTGTLF